ncbi:sugar phosphate isomerase/epimerase [Treponema sp. OMZ 840]|uniref:D-psicose 3-epimerase n=1 Tax=Treponema sp. OMZ 840 TaxID=244313 RepID=UPI003D91B9C5
MRKIGIYYAFWTHEWEADFFPFIEKVKRLGYDQLEIHGGAITSLSDEKRKALVDEAKRHNITLSYGIGVPPEYNVSSPDESIRKKGIDFMIKVIKTIGSMGGGTLGGTVHCCWPATLPKGEDKRRYIDQSLKSMNEMVGYAQDNNVVLNVEVINRFEQFILNTCEEAMAYVKAVNHPNCKILLDTFHMNIEEDSFGDAIRMAGPYLNGLHIGETNRKPAGMGRIPWQEIKEALDDINYQGSLVQEPFVMPGGQVGQNIGVWREIIPNPDLDKLAADSAAFLRKIFC